MFETALTMNDLILLAQGAGMTLVVTAISVFFGTILGILFGVFRYQVGPWWAAPLTFVLDIFRSIPLLIQLVLANAHPIVVMRTMTAFMGFQVFDETGTWLKERTADKVPESDELIIPGDLPEILLSSTLPASAVRQALHLAGPQLVAATLAGCPGEIIDHIKALDYSELWSMLLDWEISEARYRLSSDELADAQSAFAELLASTGDLESAAALEEEAWQMGVDESLVADISNLIMELDEKLLKTILSNMDPKLAAALIQAMEPIAHDRIFSSIGSSRGKKLLDALEAASPLSTPELTRKAQAFAQRVLSEIAPRGKVLGGTLQMSARLRQALTAILSRE